MVFTMKKIKHRLKNMSWERYFLCSENEYHWLSREDLVKEYIILIKRQSRKDFE